MSRRQQDPLRALSAEERAELTRLSRSRRAPAAWVARATALLAMAEGQSYLAAARQAGRRDNDTVAAWVARFNRQGLAAVQPRHGGRPSIRDGAAEQPRILEEAGRPPDRARDGTATGSLSTLQRALRRADDGLPTVSTDTIWQTRHGAGLSWQQSRTWCETGVVVRQRKRGGPVAVRDPDAVGKKRGSSGHPRAVPGSAWRSGARTRPAPFKPCRTPAAAGGRRMSRRRSHTRMCVAVPPRF